MLEQKAAKAGSLGTGTYRPFRHDIHRLEPPGENSALARGAPALSYNESMYYHELSAELTKLEVVMPGVSPGDVYQGGSDLDDGDGYSTAGDGDDDGGQPLFYVRSPPREPDPSYRDASYSVGPGLRHSDLYESGKPAGRLLWSLAVTLVFNAGVDAVATGVRARGDAPVATPVPDATWGERPTRGYLLTPAGGGGGGSGGGVEAEETGRQSRFSALINRANASLAS